MDHGNAITYVIKHLFNVTQGVNVSLSLHCAKLIITIQLTITISAQLPSMVTVSLVILT